MIPSVESSFIAYELDGNEQLQAYTYSVAQRAGIQNLIAAAAEEALAIQLSQDELTVEAIKRRSYLQGQIDILQHLLKLHTEISAASKQSN